MSLRADPHCLTQIYCIVFGVGRSVVNENTCPMEVLLFDNQEALVNNENMVSFGID